jgi:hypothetical protein
MTAPHSIPSAPSWPPTGAPSPSRRWRTIAWLVAVAVVAGVGLAGWLRPVQDHKSGPAAPTYTDQQIATAKSKVCAAAEKMQHSRDLVQQQVGSSDHATQLGVAALTEIDLDFSNRYLLATLAEEPATPAELAAAVRKQADAFQQVLINYLDGVYKTDPAMQPALNAADVATDTIRQTCK